MFVYTVNMHTRTPEHIWISIGKCIETYIFSYICVRIYI